MTKKNNLLANIIKVLKQKIKLITKQLKMFFSWFTRILKNKVLPFIWYTILELLYIVLICLKLILLSSLIINNPTSFAIPLARDMDKLKVQPKEKPSKNKKVEEITIQDRIKHNFKAVALYLVLNLFLENTETISSTMKLFTDFISNILGIL